MQKEKNKFNISNLIIVLIICSAVFYAALHVRIGNSLIVSKEIVPGAEILEPDRVIPDKDENYEAVGFNLGNFLYKDIYINGYHINNWQLNTAFIKVADEIYVPASSAVLDALGLEIDFDDESHRIDFTLVKTPKNGAVFENNLGNNLRYKEVYYGHEYIINGRYAPVYSALTTKEDEGKKRSLYLSLDALKKYGRNDISWYYDEIGGLYISTDRDIDAREYYSENNAKYIEGRARYMMSINPDLKFETAIYYEYLFRHEASVYKYCTEDRLISICQTESRFTNKAVSSVEAIGLMQVMLIYAQSEGYTYEMLCDPHYNIQRGASWYNMFVEYCEGNPEYGLAAYYLGPGNLYAQIRETGTYDSFYADVCNHNKDMLQSYVKSNGYSNTFIEYTGK